MSISNTKFTQEEWALVADLAQKFQNQVDAGENPNVEDFLAGLKDPRLKTLFQSAVQGDLSYE